MKDWKFKQNFRNSKFDMFNEFSIFYDQKNKKNLKFFIQISLFSIRNSIKIQLMFNNVKIFFFWIFWILKIGNITEMFLDFRNF